MIEFTRVSKPSRENDPDRERRGATPTPTERPREIGGPRGPEPTRYGDWERKGRCVDF